MYMKYYPWMISLRLKTLPLSLCSIVVGNALAYWQYQFNFWIMLLAIITASLLQILSNLANDYGDAIKGTDKLNLTAHARGIQLGLITLKQLKIALQINIILCVFAGISLLTLACNTLYELYGFIVLGLLSIIAAITYTVGKKPYGYIGLGDLSVLIFFGLIGVIGSYYLQTKTLSFFIIFPALGCGLLSVAVLNINNLRDLESDKKNHKRTLIVLIGKKLGQIYHLILLIAALFCFSLFAYHTLQSIWAWLFMLISPLFIKHIFAVFRFKTAKDATPLLLQMVKLALLTNLLYCSGIMLS
ncbi:1,4-dihydroxy-2-naphthoate octaprenyltransferase [Gilliamella sp. Choc4-2]|uniref:1,4-dihydroxy-2-naphthoate polyprenyltransferase n=2 Tax=Gilliamella TaxID=1193503 RepID=UPI00080DCCE9|nr:1,4-dihydroxy-2-naphthoate polyprenyltransferase [Gilliamella apicola]OCG31018.1 1,4-dihydroxy-2-naphthoate octaprenyltransferase [Gilliamella apicola]OCG46586.1 1,4-dihydroxy-2-naphthoate octaprenyltransferase [Gilliamella apicola]OCG55869.1 1,4-dihydroxy-2-naphthoate octaprenyltransferase [Gilliamella apicola]